MAGSSPAMTRATSPDDDIEMTNVKSTFLSGNDGLDRFSGHSSRRGKTPGLEKPVDGETSWNAVIF
jgi:hypothetical protein